MEIIAPRSKTWAYTYNPSRNRIIAAQHFCGIDGHAINARLDDADNWYCPRCNEIYASADQYAFLVPKAATEGCAAPSQTTQERNATQPTSPAA